MYCKHCYKMIDNDAGVCPNCGNNPNDKNNTPKIVALIVAGVLLALFLFIFTLKANSLVSEPIDDGTVETAYSLPHLIGYNEKNVSLCEVSPYQLKSGYTNKLLVIIKFDISELDEDELYWFKESDLDLCVIAFHEKNDITVGRCSLYGTLLFDAGDLYYVYDLSRDCRYDLSGVSLYVDVDLRQEETYSVENERGFLVEKHIVNHIDYNVYQAETIPDYYDMPSKLLPYVSKWVFT